MIVSLLVGRSIQQDGHISPHYDGAFDADGAAERNEYEKPVAYPFYFSDYPGYSHVKTKDDGSSAFGEGDEFVT